jgi:carbamoyl-phosphate synthase small subunit
MPMTPIPVTFLLENGVRFEGFGYGDFSKPRSGEFVFCTAMSGIEESLTDPSFAGQVLVSTVSHVGNTGHTEEDGEASKIWAEGLICRRLEDRPSNWRAKSAIPEWIVREGRFAIEGVDTRMLTIVLREDGSQRGVAYRAGSMTDAQALEYIKTSVPDMNGLDLTGKVTCSAAYDFQPGKEGYWPLAKDVTRKTVGDVIAKPKIAVWDFGVKTNTLRILSALGADVRVLPATAKAEELLAAGKDGIFLSNGPGDPAAATHIIEEMRKVLGKRPMFGICLGHQLTALAAGAKTYKMKFGHRGIHHPVVQLDAQGRALRTWITSQNHGFAVDPERLPKGVRVSFVHGDDHSVEGLSLPEYRTETVQFHPEAAPGPTDSSVLIKDFVEKVIYCEH